MKYFWTLFWVFLLVQMIGYVGSQMVASTYDFKTAATLGIIATVIVSILAFILPKDVEGENSTN